jgi:hypothetical protein
VNLVSNIISISNQGPYPLIPGSNIYAITTDVINGLQQGVAIFISGVQSTLGNFNGPNIVAQLAGIQTVIVVSSAVGPFVQTGQTVSSFPIYGTIYGAAFGVAGAGGYTGSPGNGLQGATCYASEQVTNVQDLGLNAGSGYITISLVQ